MRAHASTGQFSCPTTPKTVLSLLATSTRRLKLRRLVVACTDATPADTQALISIRYMTADGTGTANNGAVGPQQDDPADGAPAITSKTAYTVEPTYQNGTMDFGLHNRNTADIRFDEDVAPATNLSGGTIIGIGIVMSCSAAKNYNVTPYWEE